ncbi:hypothetical protein MSAN_00370100 [Mycena sanguinolenta]|uniref:Uncharacterized protein n=1 Tax=Mycena sanguinolenta TaxID=230812 RepID=A0A8H6ZEK4_9AGAR|nr:hypothetical protein MSAN_00370100 [Mycena sanguinolenta]
MPDDSCLSDTDIAEPIVSVDAFLRRTAYARGKVYGTKRKRLRIDDSVDPEETDEKPRETETPPSRSGVSASLAAKPIRRQSKPLKKRLLRAAVFSNVEPEEWLQQEDPIPSTRKPLPLVEQQHLPRERVQTKRRTWSLVDPRKTAPVQSNSFSSRAKAPLGTKTNTLSGWRETYGQIDGAAISKRKTTASVASQVPMKCSPLSFVSLHEAEKSYSLMRLPRNKIETEVPRRDFVVQSNRIPLKFTSVDQHHSSPTVCIAPKGPSMESPRRTLPLASTSAVPDPLPTALEHDTRPASLNTSADDPMPPARPEPTSCPASAPVHSDPPASPPRSPPQSTNVALKPLASFFDQFLQTARAETQLAWTKKKTPHKNQLRSQAIPPPQPIGTLKSFLRTSVRNNTSVHRYQNRRSPSYSSHANSTNVPAFGVVPSMTTQFRSPSSPDSRRVFHPTPYQVVLPSTPPTSHQPELYTTDGNDHDMPLVDSSINLFCFSTRARD